MSEMIAKLETWGKEDREMTVKWMMYDEHKSGLYELNAEVTHDLGAHVSIMEELDEPTRGYMENKIRRFDMNRIARHKK